MSWSLKMTVIISLAVLPVFIYVSWRLGTALMQRWNKSKFSIRLILFWIIGWIYLLPLQYLITDRRNLFIYTDTLQWQDYLFLYPFWLSLILVLEIVAYFIFIDLVNLAFKLKKVSFIDSWQRWQEQGKIILVLVFLIYVPIRSYVDTNYPRLQETEISLNNLRPELNGLRLSLIGDLQVDRYTQSKKLIRMQDKLGSLQTDFLFFAGDIVTSGKDHIPQALQIMCKTMATNSKVACLGDHDFWSAGQMIADGLTDCGWHFLDNQHQTFNHGNQTILVTGITHIYSRRISAQQFKSLLDSAPPADLKIVLVHQPDEKLIEIAAQQGYHLFLAGHTHGGQIVFRPMGLALTPSQLEGSYYSGHYTYKNMQIIVSNGIGLTLAPLRYHSRSEINHLVIKTAR